MNEEKGRNAAPGELSLKISYVLYAPPLQAFSALTDSAQIAQWSGSHGEVQGQVDGVFEYFDGWVKGKVVAWEQGKQLSLTWKPKEWNRKTPDSLVTLTFSAHAAGTELTIEHTHFPGNEEAKKHHSGWIDHVLEPLNDHFTLALQ